MCLKSKAAEPVALELFGESVVVLVEMPLLEGTIGQEVIENVLLAKEAF